VKIIIVGAGEVGYHFAEWLAQEKKEVVVIDVRPEALQRVSDHLDVQIMMGSGANPRVLEESGLKTADIILTVTDKDEVNLIACFFANVIAPHIQKVALIRNPDYVSYREALTRDILNIGLVINPEMEVANSILRIMSAPEVEEVNEFVGGRIKMLGKHLPSDSPLNGLKLMQLPEKIERNRMIIAALVRKCMRIMVVLKHGYRELIRLIHPRGVIRLKLGDQVVPPEIFASIAGFIFLYLGLAAVSIFLVAAAGVDLVTTISSVLACLGNVCPGLGEVGPMDNYAGMPVFAKWILSLDMLLGRL
jgi:Trk K+ transport system NAD-binding subunit